MHYIQHILKYIYSHTLALFLHHCLCVVICYGMFVCILATVYIAINNDYSYNS